MSYSFIAWSKNTKTFKQSVWEYSWPDIFEFYINIIKYTTFTGGNVQKYELIL